MAHVSADRSSPPEANRSNLDELVNCRVCARRFYVDHHKVVDQPTGDQRINRRAHFARLGFVHCRTLREIPAASLHRTEMIGIRSKRALNLISRNRTSNPTDRASDPVNRHGALFSKHRSESLDQRCHHEPPEPHPFRVTVWPLPQPIPLVKVTHPGHSVQPENEPPSGSGRRERSLQILSIAQGDRRHCRSHRHGRERFVPS